MDMIGKTQNGDAAAFVDAPAWHRKGEVILWTPDLTVPELIVAAVGPDYGISKRPLFYEHGGEMRQSINLFGLFREPDGLQVSPVSVTEQYQPVEFHALGKILQQFVEAGKAIPDAAFLLEDKFGRPSREVVTARLIDDNGDDLDAVPGDTSQTHTYMVLYNPHAGGRVKFKLIRFRVVCHNTLTAGMTGGADIGVTHSGDVEFKIDDAVKRFMLFREQVSEINAKLAKLATVSFPVDKAVDAVLGIADIRDASTQLRNKRDRLIDASDNRKIGTFGKTLFDVYNAVTFDTTHFDGGKGGKNAMSRLTSQMFSQRGKVEEKTLEVLLDLAS